MYYFQFYVALWTDKPLRVTEKEKYRSSGEPFCSEAKLSDEKVLTRQSRLHGKFAARLAEIPTSRYIYIYINEGNLSEVHWQKERGTLAVTPFSLWRRNSSLSRLISRWR